MSDPETLKIYSAKADDYVALTSGSVIKDPMFDAFLAELPSAASILDLGCGPGHFSAAMAARGHAVTALDAVPEMVDLAAAHSGVTAHVATFDEITGENLYDGVWANFSLLHAARDMMPKHLAALHKALKPKGVFHIALKSGTGSKRDTLGRLYTYYTDTELTAMLEKTGFTVTDRASGCDIGMDGAMADWIALRARG